MKFMPEEGVIGERQKWAKIKSLCGEVRAEESQENVSPQFSKIV